MSSVHRGECFTKGGLYRPTHLCVAHLNCTKSSHSFFFGVVRLGGVWRGGGMVHVSGGRGLQGFCFLEEGGMIWVSSCLYCYQTKCSTACCACLFMGFFSYFDPADEIRSHNCL